MEKIEIGGCKMLKRKYGNRPDWKRILKRRYAQLYLDTKEFTGYIALLKILQVTEPLYMNYKEEDICIVDDGYMWLQQFPHKSNHAITTAIDENGNVVQWYIDICLQNEEEKGIPFLDDLYLDIVVLPTGEIFLLDEDELEEAFAKGVIDQSQYNLAWKEANRLMNLLHDGNFDLLKLTENHKEILAMKN